MITGIPSIDNEWRNIEDAIFKSLGKKEQLKKDFIEKIKNANIKEKEFLIFKAFFNRLSYIDKDDLKIYLKKNPLIFDRVWLAIEQASESRDYSSDATYNRNYCCKEIMHIYKSLLDKMSVLARELNINNSLELSILFSYLLWNGYLSKTKKHEFKANDKDELVGLLFADITNGIGVCRNYSEMLKDYLDYVGYKSIILANYLDDNIKVNYRMNINSRKGYTSSNERTLRNKKANHVFNLIEDNGLYIYDPTNLLLYSLQNKNYANLINGKGKNQIYSYQSYGFIYSEDDEKMLDRIFTEDKFECPYSKTDFISTSEVNLELIRNSKSLLEDFYIEAKPDIVSISEETKKTLTRKK